MHGMAKRIAAVKVRQSLGSLLDDVKLTGAEYLIERDGEPTAAVIPIQVYQSYLVTRGGAFDRIEELRRRLAQSPSPIELEAVIVESEREIRG